jgi:hypothetical protein
LRDLLGYIERMCGYQIRCFIKRDRIYLYCMDDFTDIMRKRTDRELLIITTTERADYQPKALLAAEAELKSRNLTAEQLADAQAQVDETQREEEQKMEKWRSAERKIVNMASELHPLTGLSTSKTIRILAITLTIGYGIQVFLKSGLLISLLLSLDEADISVLEFLTPIVLFPFGLYGFWKMRKYGWVLLVVVITYITVGNLTTLAIEIKWELQGSNGISRAVADAIFYNWGLAFYVGRFVVFAGILYVLNKPNILGAYGVSRATQWKVIGWTAVPSILSGLTLL